MSERDDKLMLYVGRPAIDLAWQRTSGAQNEDFSAFDSDEASYVRVFLNLTVNQFQHRWLWVVSVKDHFNEIGSAKSRRDAVDQATASYWMQTLKAEICPAEML